MGLLDANDLDFMQNSLEGVEEDTGDLVLVYTTSGSTGSTSYEPASVTQVHTDQPTLCVSPLSAQEIETSGGKYQGGDIKMKTVGSLADAALVVWQTGTYEVVDGPVKIMVFGQPLTYRTVLRRAR